MNEEKVILVDSEDKPIGTLPKMEAHEKGVLHRAFSVFILNQKGEFISAADGATILKLIEDRAIQYADIDDFGKYEKREDAIAQHIETILAMPLVDVANIRSKKFKIVVDVVNFVAPFDNNSILNLKCIIINKFGIFYSHLNMKKKITI